MIRVPWFTERDQGSSVESRAGSTVSWRRRAVLWAGFALILLSLFLPVHGCRAELKDFEPPPDDGTQNYSSTFSPLLVPIRSISEDLSRGGIWEVRTWYPYFLVPLWLLLIIGSNRGDAARRRRMGALALLLSVLIALFEAGYLWTSFGTGWNAWGPRWLRPILVLGIWTVVLFVLVHRRPGRGRVEDVEATISSQALLGAMHAFSFPLWDFARPILNGRDPWPAFAAVSCNYRYGLWVAALGFLLVARPGYSSKIN